MKIFNKSEWKKVKLGDICDLRNGVAIKSEDYINISNTLNCRMSNIRPDGTFNILYNAKYLPDNFSEKYKNYLLNDGDLVIAMTDMSSDPKILGIPTVVKTNGFSIIQNQRVGKLELLTKDIDENYLKLVLQSKKSREYFKKFSTGGVQLNLSKKEILNVPIVLANINEQKKLARLFKLIEDFIKFSKEELQKLNFLNKSLFTRMFGDPLINDRIEWKFFKIKNIGKIISGATPTTNIPEYWGGDYSWITPAELNDNSFIVNSTERKLTYLGIKSSSLIELPMGTVLLSSRAPIGKVAIVGKNMYSNQGFKNIVPNKELNSIYLYYILKEKKEYLNFLGRGATFKELSKEIVENISIKVPPIELQNKFAKRVEKIEKLSFNFLSTLFFDIYNSKREVA